MATGRQVQLTKQVGEYLVAAELSRRGLLTATFAGNVPDDDIVATGSRGQTALVQVKAIAGPSWQFDILTFTDVRYKAGAQTMGQPTTPPAGALICVFVRLNKDGYGADRFYVLRWPELQRVLINGYRSYLERHGGRRPKRADSFHTALREAVTAYGPSAVPGLRAIASVVAAFYWRPGENRECPIGGAFWTLTPRSKGFAPDLRFWPQTGQCLRRARRGVLGGPGPFDRGRDQGTGTRSVCS